jgi:hypothetical protein
MKLDQKRRLVGHHEYALLDHHTLDVVVLHDHVLLKYLYCVRFLGVLALGEHHLAEAALTEHLQEVEIGHLDRV